MTHNHRYECWAGAGFQRRQTANQRVLEAGRGLTDHQLDAGGPGTGWTLRELLIHVGGGQLTLIVRTKGRQHEGEASQLEAWPDISELMALAQHWSDELIDIDATLDEDVEVGLPWQGAVYQIPNVTEVRVAPGVTDTVKLDWMYAHPAAEAVTRRASALGRIGQPDDTAAVVVSLASQDARWITGQILDATGGIFLGRPFVW